MVNNNFLLDNRYIFREDSSILFDSNTGIEHHLNEMACVIVSKLKSGSSVDNVAKYISELCNVSCNIVREDIADMLNKFESPDAKKMTSEFEKIIPPSIFPYAIEFELTRLCNWNCLFCYNTWKIDDTSGIKGEKVYLDIESIFRILREGRENGLLRVRYSGGEPTLHPDFNRIIEYAAKLNYYQVLFTNGSSISRSTVPFWIDCNIKEIMISLHGNSSSHDHLTGKIGSYHNTI